MGRRGKLVLLSFAGAALCVLVVEYIGVPFPWNLFLSFAMNVFLVSWLW